MNRVIRSLAKSRRLVCRYCSRAFAHIGSALAHRDECTAEKPMERAR